MIGNNLVKYKTNGDKKQELYINGERGEPRRDNASFALKVYPEILNRHTDLFIKLKVNNILGIVLFVVIKK